jgi:hypothetical protein
MPRISFFHGITIAMFWDEAHHRRPHFHAGYGGRQASIEIDGGVLARSLPRRQLRLVQEWARLHREELDANWRKARDDQPLDPIDPLP